MLPGIAKDITLFFIAWYGAALVWPWTSLGWRTFGIPSAVALMLSAVVLAYLRGPRSSALALQEHLDRLDEQAFKRLAGTLAGFFFLWLADVKLCQHFTFQTHFADLGQDANVAWNTLHGRMFFDSVYQRNFLGDHFEPVLALCSLGFLVWKNAAALLVIQSLALASAIIPLCALSRVILKHQGLTFAIAALFLANVYLHTVSAYEFHPETLFVPSALWALYFVETRRPWAAVLIAMLCLSIKEDIPLALAGFGIYLGLGGAKGRTLVSKKYGWFLALASLSVFFAIILWVIPGFAESKISVHWHRYAELGKTNEDIVRNVLSHPWLLVERLMRGRVILTIIGLLASVGFLPCLSPLTLVPILSACVHHLVSDYRPQYILGTQYSCQTIPFLFYGAIRGLHSIESAIWNKKRWIPAALITICAVNILYFPQYVSSFQWKEVSEISRLIRKIPAHASVAGEMEDSYFAHLTLRRDLSHFVEGPLRAADWPANVRLMVRPDLIVYSDQQPTFQLPQTEYALFDSSRHARYARFLANSAQFSRIGSGGGFELWRVNRKP